MKQHGKAGTGRKEDLNFGYQAVRVAGQTKGL